MTARPAANRRPPRNPWLGFAYAGVALGGAAAGAAALALDGPRIAAFELTGQRSEGFVVVLPLLLAVGGAVALVRAILAIGPWRRRGSEADGAPVAPPRDAAAVGAAPGSAPAAAAPPAAPRGLPVAITALGVLALGGLAALALVRPDTAAGVAVQIEVGALLLLLAIACLRAGISGLRAAASGPGGEPGGRPQHGSIP